MLIIKHERFIETKKICRDLTHFVFKCSVTNYSINQMFHLLSTNYHYYNSFFVDMIVFINFRFLLKDIFIKSIFINIIFDLLIYR